MNSTVSLSVRSIVLALALSLAVVAAFLVGSATHDAAPAAAATTSAGPERTITMAGSGDATGVPDQLTFRLSVGSTADDVSTAMDQTTAKVRAAVKALRGHGVQKKDTATAGLSIEPVYVYPDNAPPVLTGYRVRESVTVLVRSLREGGKALSAAIEAGGNSSRVSGLHLKLGDTDALMAKARAAAVADATAKAREYAGAAGQALGDVVTIREVRATPPPVYGDIPMTGSLDALRAAAPKAIPIQAGSKTLDVQVSVVWQLASE